METELRGELREELFSTLRYCLEKKKGEGEKTKQKTKSKRSAAKGACQSEDPPTPSEKVGMKGTVSITKIK